MLPDVSAKADRFSRVQSPVVPRERPRPTPGPAMSLRTTFEVADYQRRLADAERARELAIENPCRRERCEREGLHAEGTCDDFAVKGRRKRKKPSAIADDTTNA